jgi:MFS family permease
VSNVTEPSATRRSVCVLLAGTFVVTFDFFAVSMLLVPIRAELRASESQLQWVVAVFGLSYGSALLCGARLGDKIGSRRAYTLGCAGFTVAAFGSAFSLSAGMLVGLRALQGLGAAVLSPQVLSQLARLADPAAKARAFAGYGMVLGLGSGLGQLIAAALLASLPGSSGWRAVFTLIAGLGLAATLASLQWAKREHNDTSSQRIDMPSAGLLLAGAFALLAPVIEGRRLGWPAWTAASALAGLIALAALWRRQQSLEQTGGTPLIAPALLRDARFVQALLAVFVFYGGVASFFMLLSFDLQSAQGLGPVAAALTFSVMVGGFLAATFGGKNLQARWGDRAAAAGAMALAVGHFALGAAAALQATRWVQWPLLAATGFSLGLVMSPLIARAVSLAPVVQAGTAAGLIGTSQWLGNACGVATVASLYFSMRAGTGAGAASLAMTASHIAFALLAAAVSHLLFAALPHRVIIRSP